MTEEVQLSRREREILNILYAQGGATTMEVVGAMANPPTDKAVRRLLHILEEKGHVRRRQRGREVVYVPKRSKRAAGTNALQHVIDTFFGGALDDALAAHFAKKEVSISPDQLQRIKRLIDETREEGG